MKNFIKLFLSFSFFLTNSFALSSDNQVTKTTKAKAPVTSTVTHKPKTVTSKRPAIRVQRPKCPICSTTSAQVNFYQLPSGSSLRACAACFRDHMDSQ